MKLYTETRDLYFHKFLQNCSSAQVLSWSKHHSMYFIFLCQDLTSIKCICAEYEMVLIKFRMDNIFKKDVFCFLFS